MNKSDLLQIIGERLKNLSKKEIELIVNTVFDQMSESLIQGNRIEIRGFGTFEVRTRQARQGRNPKSGTKVFVATRRVPFFKVGKELREMINHELDSSPDEENKTTSSRVA